MTLTYDGLRLKDALELSGWKAFGVVALLALFLGGGQFLFPLWLLCALPIVVAAGLSLTRSASFAFYAFVGVILALSFRFTTTVDLDIVDLLAAACVGGVLTSWSAKLWIVNREQLSTFLPQTFLHLFLGYAILIGIGGTLFWNNSWLDLVREVSIYAPLLIVPILYVRAIGTDETKLKMFLRFLLVVSVCILFWSGIRYFSNVAAAAYAYQIGRMVMDFNPPVLLFLACIAISLFRLPWMKTIWRLGISLVCLGAIVISNYRTVWVALFLATIVLFAVARGADRKSGFGFLAKFGGVVAAFGMYLYFTMPIFKIFVLMQVDRFISTAQVTTDPSLMNRYIEYDYFWRYFLESPIVGYGLGAKFEVFDWLLGYTYFFNYSHNGFLFIAVKSGIIGFVLLYGAFFGFLIKGIRLARDVQQRPEIRAISAIGVAFVVSLLVMNSTLNIFAHRTQLMWVGLFWGFWLCYRVHKHEQPAKSVQLAKTDQPTLALGSEAPAQ